MVQLHRPVRSNKLNGSDVRRIVGAAGGTKDRQRVNCTIVPTHQDGTTISAFALSASSAGGAVGTASMSGAGTMPINFSEPATRSRFNLSADLCPQSNPGLM